MDRIVYLNRSDSDPGFSRLATAVQSARQPRARAVDWANFIRALPQKGVRQLEIDDSGIIDSLMTRPDESIPREDLVVRIRELSATIKEIKLDSPQYAPYRQPGGDYAEFLYIANTQRDNCIDDLDWVEYRMGEIASMGVDEDNLAEALHLEQERTRLKKILANSKSFIVPHWRESATAEVEYKKNQIAHCRATMRPEQGLYFIEEIQSDWAQSGRANDWKTVPRGPLVTNTEAWAGMVLRRQLQIAASDPRVQHVAWITESMSNGAPQNTMEERRKTELCKAYQAARKPLFASMLAALEGSNEYRAMPPDRQLIAKEALNNQVTAQLAIQGFQNPNRQNGFYLEILPKLADKIISGTGQIVSMRDFTLGGRQVSVPTLEITDTVREKLTMKQPVYSRANLRATPLPEDDPRVIAALKSGKEMLGSMARLRLLSKVYDTARGDEVAGSMVNRLVSVSLKAVDPEEVMDHECYHFAEEYLLDSRERDLVRAAFAPGTDLNRRVQDLCVQRGDIKLARSCATDASEAAAQGFALWRRKELVVTEPTPRGLFEQVADAVQVVSKWLKRLVADQHLQSVTDVFAALQTGDLREREEARETEWRGIGMRG